MFSKTRILLVGLLLVASPAFADIKGQFHLHSKFSDGFLTPKGLCEQAVQRKVKVLVPLDHGNGKSSIDSKVKEIDLKPENVDPQFVGIDNYLSQWAKLAKDFNLTIIPGAEYEIVDAKTGKAVHLGAVGITVELHHKMVKLCDDKALSVAERVKRAFALIYEHKALPLVAHSTLKMAHPESLGKITKEYKVTDYSFPAHLWQDQPFVLVEAMNHGNLDTEADLVPMILGEGSPEDPSIVLVAGCDFHTWKAETLGAMIGNRLLGRPSRYPTALDRFTWIRTDKDKLSADEIMEKLRKGNTYLTYGSFALEPMIFDDDRRQYRRYDIKEEVLGDSDLVMADVSLYFRRALTGNWSYKLYRDDSEKPISSGSLKGKFDYYYIEKDIGRHHRYLVVIPGGAMVGPYYCRPWTVTEKREMEAEQALQELRATLWKLQPLFEALEFRLEITASLQNLLTADVNVKPVAIKQVDRQRHDTIYLYVDVYNPESGDVVELRNNRNNSVQRYAIPADKVKPGNIVRIIYEVAVGRTAPDELSFTVRVRDAQATAKVRIVEGTGANQSSQSWKTVRYGKLEISLPADWTKDPPGPRVVGADYSWVVGQSWLAGVELMVHELQRSISLNSMTELLVMFELGDEWVLISKRFENTNGLRKLTLEWQDRDYDPFRGHYWKWKRLVALQQNGRTTWMVFFEQDVPVAPRVKEIINKITASIKLIN